MVLTNNLISPLKEAGTYQTLINNIREFTTTDGGTRIVYYLTVFTPEGNVEIRTGFKVSNYRESPFWKFKTRLIESYGNGFNTDDHIGQVVNAVFEINCTESGDEYTNLIGYSPLEDSDSDSVTDEPELPFSNDDAEIEIIDDGSDDSIYGGNNNE